MIPRSSVFFDFDHRPTTHLSSGDGDGQLFSHTKYSVDSIEDYFVA